MKRRGRKTKLNQVARLEARSTTTSNTPLRATPATDRNDGDVPPRTATLKQHGFVYDAGDDSSLELPPREATISSWQRHTDHGEHLPDPSTQSSSFPTLSTPPPSTHLLSSEPSEVPAHQDSPAATSRLFEPLDVHSRGQVDGGSIVESPALHGSFSFDTPTSTSPSYFPKISVAAAQISEPRRVPFPSPSIVSSRRTGSDSGSSCYYPVITPLLPILADIMPVSIACDLLQLYFDQPGSSVLKCASPYVLTHVVRRRAVLHPSNPRPTSPALLLSMLYATAHTADIAYFHVPGSRTTVCDKLYAAVVGQLRDPDDWHRLLNGAWVMLCNGVQDNRASENEQNDKTKGWMTGPDAGTDDILAIILVTIVVSGGTFKADCLRWWHKALRLARLLKLAQLDDRNEMDSSQSFSEIEATEEKRRVFWLLFSLDRHLALSFNSPLTILDADVSVYLPLPETVWEYLDTQPLPLTYSREYGPKTTISGTGFFEFFLPLMTILGDIVVLHHRRLHPRFGALNDDADAIVVEKLLKDCEHSLNELQNNAEEQNNSAGTPSSLPTTVGSGSRSAERSSSMTRLRLVTAYSTHILHVLAVLLYGKWDPLAMLAASSTSTPSVAEDSDDWMNPARFMKCASHAVAASQAVATIITLDPELVFMPYLFGIYLLHGSFILLLFADRMPQLGGPNPEVEQACETVIRAHEVCVVTLSTEFQRSFRRVLRSTLNSVTNIVPSDVEESRARRDALEMYRWSRGGRGLAL